MKLIEIAEYISKYGVEYPPGTFPAHLQRGNIGDCYDTCILQALKHRLIYVEGFASVPGSGEILHSWLTDGTRAFDPTWMAFDDKGQEIDYACTPVRYIGIPFPNKLVVQFLRKTGYKGLLANHFRDPDLIDNYLKEVKHALSRGYDPNEPIPR